MEREFGKSPLEGLERQFKLVPGKTDSELAEEIKAGVMGNIEPLLLELTKAKAQGFEVTFGIATDALGKSFLQTLRIMKEF